MHSDLLNTNAYQCKKWGVIACNNRYRTAELFLKHPSPPSVHYNDKDLYKQLLEKYPEVSA